MVLVGVPELIRACMGGWLWTGVIPCLSSTFVAASLKATTRFIRPWSPNMAWTLLCVRSRAVQYLIIIGCVYPSQEYNCAFCFFIVPALFIVSLHDRICVIMFLPCWFGFQLRAVKGLGMFWKLSCCLAHLDQCMYHWGLCHLGSAQDTQRLTRLREPSGPWGNSTPADLSWNFLIPPPPRMMLDQGLDRPSILFPSLCSLFLHVISNSMAPLHAWAYP